MSFEFKVRHLMHRLWHLRFFLALSLVGTACATVAADQPHTFDIHFVVITRNPAAHKVATIEQLRSEVDILNRYFVTERREPMVTFRFKSAVPYNAIQDAKCEFATLGDLEHPLDTNRATILFNSCDDPRIRDKRAINFYVYDAYAVGIGFMDATGHGRRNSNRPFVLLDWQRLNHGDQAAEEHEMGHAFGLEHICVPGATRRTSTNIMASADCGKGSGGLRDLGFDDRQMATILRYAAEISKRLGSSH